MSKRENSGVVLGLDLGTTNSAVAILEADGSAKIVFDADGEAPTPSVVNLSNEKHPVVGRAAVNQRVFAPEETASLFKRPMGKSDADGQATPAFVHPKSGKAYSPEESSSCVIRYLIENAEAVLGTRAIGVVISVPAYFENAARKATRRAGELAGVKVLRIENEPTAAGLAFGLDGNDDGIYAVFDLGGGTFDISILRIHEGDFDVLTTDGDRDCGGSDVDNLIAQEVAAAFKDTRGIEVTPEGDLVTWREILDKSENAKRTLSQSEIASFMISAQGQRIQFDLKRSKFEALIAPMIENTKAITERALEAAKLKPKDVKGTILVGGSTRIPAVRQMLTGLFGKAPLTTINPDEVVALGAAIYAARMAADSGLSMVDTQGRKVLPPPIRVTDVNSHPLGCLAMVDGVLRNCVIIPANSPLPAEKEDQFALVDEDQMAAKVTISTGPDRADPADCTIHGDLTLPGLPSRPTSENSIRVKYRYTVEGTLEVTITDMVSGKSTSELKRGFDGFATGTSQT